MFAATLTVDLQTVRKCFVQTESYYGVRPSKLPGLRLLWPAEPVKQLLTMTRCAADRRSAVPAIAVLFRDKVSEQ